MACDGFRGFSAEAVPAAPDPRWAGFTALRAGAAAVALFPFSRCCFGFVVLFPCFFFAFFFFFAFVVSSFTIEPAVICCLRWRGRGCCRGRDGSAGVEMRLAMNDSCAVW